MCLPYVSFVVGQMEIVLFLPCQVTNFHCLPPLIAYLKQKKKKKKEQTGNGGGIVSKMRSAIYYL